MSYHFPIWTDIVSKEAVNLTKIGSHCLAQERLKLNYLTSFRKTSIFPVPLLVIFPQYFAYISWLVFY
jgi:hypothetical protein